MSDTPCVSATESPDSSPSKKNSPYAGESGRVHRAASPPISGGIIFCWSIACRFEIGNNRDNWALAAHPPVCLYFIFFHHTEPDSQSQRPHTEASDSGVRAAVRIRSRNSQPSDRWIDIPLPLYLACIVSWSRRRGLSWGGNDNLPSPTPSHPIPASRRRPVSQPASQSVQPEPEKTARWVRSWCTGKQLNHATS